MIYLKLFFSFIKIGLFAFGGAYGAIPLIHDVVMSNDWLNEEMFSNIVAISETTPGPIMVNMATYIGSKQAGILGAILATLGVVLPSFIILLLITIVFQSALKKKNVQAVLKGIKPCLMGVILATGVYMAVSDIFYTDNMDCTAFIIFAVLIAISYINKKFRKKEISPIMLIICAAILGGILY